MRFKITLITLSAAILFLIFSGASVFSAAKYTEADFINLRKYLLGIHASANGFDVNGNGTIDIIDLVKMRKKLAEQDNSSGQTPSQYELPFIPNF